MTGVQTCALPISSITVGTGLSANSSTGAVTIVFTGSTSATGAYLPLSGGTVTGGTSFTKGLTANTISAQTITFDTITSITPALAQINWNQTDKTLEFSYGDGDTTLQIGQETVYPPVVNKDSIDLVEGTLVMVDPTDVAQGNRLRVIRAVANGTYPSQLLVGILTETSGNIGDIDVNSVNPCCTGNIIVKYIF